MPVNRLLNLLNENQNRGRKLTVKNEGDTSHVYMYDAIGGWWGIEAESFIKTLNDITESTIVLHINSPGGVITSGMSVYDTMQYIKPAVNTVVIGQACSMGSFLAQAGEPGKRFILPNARHMIHQPSGGAQGMASDIEISYKEILYLKDRLTNLYVKHNNKGKTYEDFERDMDRDTFLTAQEAVDYGLADSVIEKR